jgi:hypothetical protein
MLRTTRHHRFSLTHPVEYDALQRRVWILGQRCHHGATGAVMAAGGVIGVALGVAVRHRPPRAGHVAATLATASAGTLLMVHDWHDRSLWFRLGPGM